MCRQQQAVKLVVFICNYFLILRILRYYAVGTGWPWLWPSIEPTRTSGSSLQLFCLLVVGVVVLVLVVVGSSSGGSVLLLLVLLVLLLLLLVVVVVVVVVCFVFSLLRFSRR